MTDALLQGQVDLRVEQADHRGADAGESASGAVGHHAEHAAEVRIHQSEGVAPTRAEIREQAASAGDDATDLAHVARHQRNQRAAAIAGRREHVEDLRAELSQSGESSERADQQADVLGDVLQSDETVRHAVGEALDPRRHRLHRVGESGAELFGHGLQRRGSPCRWPV
ncbi:hypothetical protein [Bifidobacterium bifidum]|uniref:hypothetical protein n=1 Tax=Bifidobacterium bifidum TaxID=1681 RepID=UPI003D00A8B7